jgi:mRNA interferase RelE/StbE
MSSYRIALKKSVLKEIERLDSNIVRQIISKIDSLSVNPRPFQSLKLSGSERSYRLRVGDYRILYQIDETAKLVTVYAVGHRKDIYR